MPTGMQCGSSLERRKREGAESLGGSRQRIGRVAQSMERREKSKVAAEIRA